MNQSAKIERLQDTERALRQENAKLRAALESLRNIALQDRVDYGQEDHNVARAAFVNGVLRKVTRAVAELD